MQLDCEHWTALLCVFHKHVSFHTEHITRTKTKINLETKISLVTSGSIGSPPVNWRKKQLPAFTTSWFKMAGNAKLGCKQTSVVCLWAPRVSPAASINFTEGGSFSRGKKHLGHPLSGWLCTAAASANRRARQSANARQLPVGDRQTNDVICIISMLPLLWRGLWISGPKS